MESIHLEIHAYKEPSYISQRDIDLYNSIPDFIEDMERNPIKMPSNFSLCEAGAVLLVSCIALVAYSIIS